jgi:hypothetical protein
MALKMTCLSCEKCHSHDFDQLRPFYDKTGLKQVFKCKNCGEEIHLDPMLSGIAMEGCRYAAPDTIESMRWPPSVFLAETIKRLWLEIEDIKKKLSQAY